MYELPAQPPLSPPSCLLFLWGIQLSHEVWENWSTQVQGYLCMACTHPLSLAMAMTHGWAPIPFQANERDIFKDLQQTSSSLGWKGRAMWCLEPLKPLYSHSGRVWRYHVWGDPVTGEMEKLRDGWWGFGFFSLLSQPSLKLTLTLFFISLQGP